MKREQALRVMENALLRVWQSVTPAWRAEREILKNIPSKRYEYALMLLRDAIELLEYPNAVSPYGKTCFIREAKALFMEPRE